jgi:DNA-binding NarL/FixJ family response regulator
MKILAYVKQDHCAVAWNAQRAIGQSIDVVNEQASAWVHFLAYAPQVVIVDDQLTGSLDFIHTLKHIHPNTYVILLAHNTGFNNKLIALQAGVDDFAKDETILQSIYGGMHYV